MLIARCYHVQANIRDADGRMALHAVSETINKQSEMSDVLIENGGELNALTEDGRSPLLCAVEALSYTNAHPYRYTLPWNVSSSIDKHSNTAV